MAAPGGFSYKPNVNRAVTKKWKEASKANYDDWEDDDDDDYGYVEPPAPVSAGNARHPGWSGLPSNRSATNPSPSRAPGRPSFDRGDERRVYSSGAGGFDSAYPTTQRSPFPEPQHDLDHSQNFRQPPPAQIYTQGQGPGPGPGSYPAPSFRPSSRGQQYPPHPNAPFSAPAGLPPHRRSESGNRSNPSDPHQRHESPVRPDSRASNNSARYFPPRKSSLSQQQPPDIPPAPVEATEPPQIDDLPASEVKALPFIRPSDIYKRMEEEREKERRSQDSARPSLDLSASRTRDSSTSARSANSETKDTSTAAAAAEDTDSTRRLKPTLDTVVERKSEYGFENYLRGADATHPNLQTQQGDVNRHPTNASSVYTDRPDPVSASTVSRNQSPQAEGVPQAPYSSSSDQYNLPSVGRISSFGSDFGTSMTPAETTNTTEPNHPPPPVPEKEPRTGIPTTNEVEPERLSHKPSLGYRSVVEQAFDQSQSQNPLSPVSGDDSLPRSNSATTSEISPIISRHHELPHGPFGPPVTERPIPEEPTSSGSRPLSDSTIKAGDGPVPDQPQHQPPIIQANYRRDRTPPSRDNSPAKHPLSIQTMRTQKPVLGVLGSTEHMHQAAKDESVRGRSGPSPPRSSGPTATVGGLMSPQSNHSTTSDEYKEWQDQRKVFNARFGLQDSNPATPSAPSPISRSGSPAKGSVKDLTGRYEGQSGRTTPINAATASQVQPPEPRPIAQSRQESFRPSIPGGWQSSSTIARLESPAQESANPLQPPRLVDQPKHESTESIPTAKAPQNWRQERDGPSQSAFAAAAAAGTALAGAFSGTAFSRSREDSPRRSEDSWERSTASSLHAPDHSETRDFGAPNDAHHRAQTTRPDSLPPTPLPKDTPMPTPPLANVAANTPERESLESEEDQRTDDYFPAPLRTSRSVDVKEVTRPPIPTVYHVDDSPAHGDNEQLQQDIVKSLTPKSSNFEAQQEQPAIHQAPSVATEDSASLGDSRPPAPSKEAPPLPSAAQSQEQHAADGPPRPFLEQRFSWEMESANQSPSTSQPGHSKDDPGAITPSKVTSPSTQSPDTVRAVEMTPADTPVRQSHDMSTLASESTKRPQSGTDEVVAPPTILRDTGLQPAPATSFPGPVDKVTFRKIMAMENPQQRIQAFNEARESYAHSDGMLDQWILSMKTSEHESIFQSNGQIRTGAASGPSSPHRPSPNRPLPNLTGSKIMQEDGKRLMEASKRFGGKAGVAAKGWFAKGKDKLRSASAGDKGFLTSRRKSAGPDQFESTEFEPSKRDSTVLTTPPQIPAQNLNSSPIDAGDWFGSERETQGAHPAVSKLSAAESNRFSTVSRDSRFDDEQLRQDSQTRSRSPSISVVSRSSTTRITEVNPEDHTAGPSVASEPAGAGAVALSTAPAIVAQTRAVQNTPNISIPEPQHAVEDNPPTLDTAPLATLLQVPDQHTTSSSEQNLDVPAQRPHSVISNVSSLSRSPANSHDDQRIHRSVSPADPRQSHDEVIPSYRPGVASKEAEASTDRRAGQAQDDPVPSYEEGSAAPVEAMRPRIGSDARIVAVADLSSQRRQEEIRNADRPFSFDGSEYVTQALHADEKKEPLQSPPSVPLSPVSQTLSKSLSQISVEEVPAEQDGGKRPPRSYSRPFGAAPSRDHPALRQPDPTIDRSRMYSTESPLPSARRPQEDFDHLRRPSPAPVIETREEGEYRIPGPHFQELRSPRRTSTQDGFTAVQQVQQPPPQQHMNGLGHHPTYQAQPQYQRPQPPQQWPVIAPPPPRAESSAKKSKFGGFFQSKSKQRQENAPGGEERQRNKLIRRNSRHDSIASHQSSMNEKRDVLGQLPLTDKNQRPMSRDLIRSATPTDQSDVKKKRFSGLFSRGSKSEKTTQPQRASTLPTNSPPPNRNPYPAPIQQQHFYSRPVPPNERSTQLQPQAYPQYTGPPPGGFYAPSPPPHSNQRSQHHEEQQRRYPSPYQQQQPQQPYDSRPADLRIDTTTSPFTSQRMNHPATAPPQSRAPRDISNQSHPYDYQSTLTAARVASPSASTSARLPPSSLPSASVPHDAHVVELHKRSRSPKLGRRSSSEDLSLTSPHLQTSDTGTPVGGLGTFSNKKISPLEGVPRPEQDQEAPYRIDIPGEGKAERERRRSLRQSAIEQGGVRSAVAGEAGKTVAERMTGPQISARANAKAQAQQREQQHREQAATSNSARLGNWETASPSATSANVKSGEGRPKGEMIAELPGSKAAGYESDEEEGVVMSATAYPGNWQDPVFFGEGWRDD